MPTDVLGSYNFSEAPVVNGVPLLTAATIPPTGVSAGTFNEVTVGTDGRVTGGTKTASRILAYYTGQISAASGSSIIPNDTSTPLVTEGTQLWSVIITPNSVSSKLVFNQTIMGDTSVNNRNITLALFRGNTCIYATASNTATAGRPLSMSVYAVDMPGTTSPVVYSMRVGINSSGIWYVNQSSGSAITFGGTANKSDWGVTEIE